MSFFKNLFNKSSDPKPERKLTQPAQLTIGDIIEFSDSFTLPSEIRTRKFEVKAIETIEFEHQHYPRFRLMGVEDIDIWLSLPGYDVNDFNVSMEIKRNDVEALFDMDEFADIFEDGHSELRSTTEVELGDWHADHYYQHDIGTVGYLHQTDYRHSTPPQYQEDSHGRRFEYYSLHDARENKLLDITVLDNGDTDVYLTVRLHSDSIAAFWPKA